ncbi:hypothetical protein [Adlercreutzia caecimuris]|uniref:hypothetical protein n=1 Tax=Adlercreutzia caecimuris TaxID=671266 RepID=UPI00272D42F3|nr:hypothetical protein [Adlercreutzia caecimuris]
MIAEAVRIAASEWTAPDVALFVLGCAILWAALKADKKLDEIVEDAAEDRGGGEPEDPEARRG